MELRRPEHPEVHRVPSWRRDAGLSPSLMDAAPSRHSGQWLKISTSFLGVLALFFLFLFSSESSNELSFAQCLARLVRGVFIQQRRLLGGGREVQPIVTAAPVALQCCPVLHMVLRGAVGDRPLINRVLYLARLPASRRSAMEADWRRRGRTWLLLAGEKVGPPLEGRRERRPSCRPRGAGSSWRSRLASHLAF